MRVVDAAVLAVLKDALPSGLKVCDGEVRLDGGKIAESIPYVVYYAAGTDTVTMRQSGRSKRHLSGFQLTCVGFSREQAKATAEKARAAVEGSRIVGGLVNHSDSDFVRPDPDARTTEDRSVFYAVDRYSVSV